jgi:hypothetical protein
MGQGEVNMIDQRFERFREAYLRMATEAKYRPQAPSDGCGNICLTLEQFKDDARLQREADEYAAAFIKEEDDCRFMIGCSNFMTNRAFMFAIEAARLLASGDEGNAYAVKLLKMAAKEVEANSSTKNR